MVTELRVTDASRLRDIIDEIHDYWFSIEDVVNNASKQMLEIRFTRPAPGGIPSSRRFFRKVEIPHVAAFLRVHYVIDYRIADKEQVEFYDFNEIAYSATKRQVSITTGVPISIVIDVERLEVSLVISDEFVEQRTGSHSPQ